MEAQGETCIEPTQPASVPQTTPITTTSTTTTAPGTTVVVVAPPLDPTQTYDLIVREERCAWTCPKEPPSLHPYLYSVKR
jgi:hypothetical protein